MDFNGVVPEKYDVVSLTHKVQVEYGNVGVDFKYIPREGFGWMNASYQIGLTNITKQMRRALGTITSPDIFFEKTVKPSLPKEAQEITQNGQTSAAITVIEPSVLQGSFNTSAVYPSISTTSSSSSSLSSHQQKEIVTPNDNEIIQNDYFI